MTSRRPLLRGDHRASAVHPTAAPQTAAPSQPAASQPEASAEVFTTSGAAWYVANPGPGGESEPGSPVRGERRAHLRSTAAGRGSSAAQHAADRSWDDRSSWDDGSLRRRNDSDSWDDGSEDFPTRRDRRNRHRANSSRRAAKSNRAPESRRAATTRRRDDRRARRTARAQRRAALNGQVAGYLLLACTLGTAGYLAALGI